MALDPVFASFTTQVDGLFVDQVPALVSSALAYVRSPLRAALGLYVVVHCFNMILGNGGGRAVGWAVARAFVVATAMQATYYTQYISTAFLTQWPTEIASALSGRAITAGAAQQFDVLNEGLANFTAGILMAASGWTYIPERMAALFLSDVGMIGIGAMWLQWYVPHFLTGMVLVVGPFLVPLWLFEGTRGFAMAFATKLVSLLAQSVGASVLVSILVRTINTVAAPLRNAGSSDVHIMLGKLALIVGMMWAAAFLLRFVVKALSFEGTTTAASNAMTAGTTAALASPFTAARRMAAR